MTRPVFVLAAYIRGPLCNRTRCRYLSHVTVTSCLCVRQQLKACQYELVLTSFPISSNTNSHGPEERRENHFLLLLFFAALYVTEGKTGKLWVILNCSVDFIWKFEEQRSEGEWISCIEPAAFSVTDYLRAKFRHISAFIKVSAFIIPLFKKDTVARHPSHLQSFLLLFQFCLSAPQKSRRHKRIFHRTTLPSCGCMMPLKRDHKTIHAGFTLKLHVWQFGKIWLISKRCKTHLMVSGRHMKILCKWILLDRRGYTHTHSHTGWRVIHLNPTLCPQHQILPFGPTHACRCDHNPSTLCLTLVIDRSRAPIGSSNSFTNLSFHIIDWVVLHPSFNYMQR